MAVIEVGRIVVKTRGREAGRKAVVVEIVDNNFVVVTGPKSVTGVKRRKVNINHIEPTDKKIDIPKGADDKTVEDKLKAENLMDYMKQSVRVTLPKS
ncbi:MAG: 50S ribosomal protein L14e [Sulfolobales archaeon]|jgi:large subunit ribosomal protein L14e|nr:50S ribosomal protein L14e [Sulfolobales archaeon]MCG2894410.1 50S ribosomal protein L14e [Sulfolobales archaeon]MCG2910959.1 50S ribosomal protein L14e [Sulfolobales archaeon]MCQ4336748.1 50S ribosomal protein L14e [Sulfolobales archaeon]